MIFKPYVGWGPFTFGISVDEAIALRASATTTLELRENYDREEPDKILHLPELGVELTFEEEEEYKLGTITFEREVELPELGQVIGKNYEDVAAQAKEIFNGDVLLTDYSVENGEVYRVIEIGSQGIMINCFDGIVTSVDCYTEYRNTCG